MGTNIIAGKIQQELKIAVKARDKARASTLRMLLSALKNAELDEREELSEDKELAVLASYARRCRESITEYARGGREDLVEKEKAELDVVMSFLPEQLGTDEIREQVQKIIDGLGAAGPRDVGRVMGMMMKEFKGRVDGGAVKLIVSELLKQ